MMVAAVPTCCRRLLLASGLLSILAQAKPINDLCTNATHVTTFPFLESGTLANATKDKVLFNCDDGGNDSSSWNGTDIWYIISNVPDGARIDVSTSNKFGNAEVLIDPFFVPFSFNEQQGNSFCQGGDDSTCNRPRGMVTRSAAETSVDGTRSWVYSVYWNATKDATYYVALYSKNVEEEVVPTFDLSIFVTLPNSTDENFVVANIPPSNDLCSSATEVSMFPFVDSVTLVNATNDIVLSNANFCGDGSGWNGTDVWYKISNVHEGAKVDVGTIGGGSAQVPIQIFFVPSLYEQQDNNWFCRGYEEKDPSISTCTHPTGMETTEMSIDGSSSWEYSVNWNAVKDAIYYIALYSTSSEPEVASIFDLSIIITLPITSNVTVVLTNDPPSNDNCTNATDVSVFPFNQSGILENATKDALSTCSSMVWEGNDVWYKIHDMPGGANIHVDIVGSGKGVLQAYVTKSTDDGKCPEKSQCVDPNNIRTMSSIDENSKWHSSVFWKATNESVYYLAVYASDINDASAFNIYIDYTYPPPINDSCDTATDISTFPFTDSGSLANATKDVVFSCDSGGSGWKGNDVWYKIHGVPNDVVQVDISGNGATIVQVKPLISNELGNCPDRSRCVEPLAIYAAPSIDEDTGSWEYSVVWPTTKSAIYYLALYTEDENMGPKFQISVKLSDPYKPVTSSSSSSSSTTSKASLVSSASRTKNASFAVLMRTVEMLSGILFVVTNNSY